MRSFIEFLLEKKLERLSKKNPHESLLPESQQSKISFHDLVSKVLGSASGSVGAEVKLVDKAGKTYDAKKEFKWGGETNLTSPVILVSTTGNVCKVKDLVDDASSIGKILDSHDHKLEDTVKFQLQLDSKTTDSVGYAFDSKTKTLYFGFDCDPEKVLAPKLAASQEDGEGTPVKFGSKTINLRELPAEVTTFGDFYQKQLISAKSTNSFCIVYGCHGYNLKDFDKHTIQGGDKSVVQGFGALLPDDKAKFFKSLSWTEEGMDSFIKRLEMFSLDGDGTVLMYLYFGSHPVLARLQMPKGNVSSLFSRFASASTKEWLKTITNCYLTSFNQLSTGVTILADPHQFFKKSAKFQVQVSPPFVVGKKVSSSIKADIVAASTSQGGSATAPTVVQTAPSKAKAPSKFEAANDKFQLALKKRGLGGISAAVGLGGTGLKHGPLKSLPAGQTFMSFKFPGMDPTQLVGQEAIDFLDKFHLWNGKLKNMYDDAKTEIPDLKLAISFDGRFGT